jgi:glutathione peroxidase
MILLYLMSMMFGLFNFTGPIPASIYDFKVKAIDGGEIDFSAFKGKKILIVNVASKCGYTPQYGKLDQLQNKFKDKLVVIGFPANNFLWQEPGTNSEIAQFCKLNYGVSFPLGEKISVRGWKKHPLYEWLTNKKYNHFSDSKVEWNFQKYLIDENGNLINIFEPKTNPMDPQVIESISK